MSATCSEIIWLCGLFGELGFPWAESTSVYANNISAIQIVANPVFHEHTKNIEVYCKSRVGIFIPHVSSKLQTANILTKVIPRPRHQCFFVRKLMLIDQTHQFDRGMWITSSLVLLVIFISFFPRNKDTNQKSICSD